MSWYCTVDGCTSTRRHSQELCSKHYFRQYRTGKLELDGRPGADNANCSARLNRDEFFDMKYYREQGFSPMDVAYELRRKIDVIKAAWGFDSYIWYCNPEKQDIMWFTRDESRRLPIKESIFV